jgi:hypothetical protein
MREFSCSFLEPDRAQGRNLDKANAAEQLRWLDNYTPRTGAGRPTRYHPYLARGAVEGPEEEESVSVIGSYGVEPQPHRLPVKYSPYTGSSSNAPVRDIAHNGGLPLSLPSVTYLCGGATKSLRFVTTLFGCTYLALP